MKDNSLYRAPVQVPCLFGSVQPGSLYRIVFTPRGFKACPCLVLSDLQRTERSFKVHHSVTYDDGYYELHWGLFAALDTNYG